MGLEPTTSLLHYIIKIKYCLTFNSSNLQFLQRVKLFTLVVVVFSVRDASDVCLLPKNLGPCEGFQVSRAELKIKGLS